MTGSVVLVGVVPAAEASEVLLRSLLTRNGLHVDVQWVAASELDGESSAEVCETCTQGHRP